jgi:hypothetical protein
MICICQICKTDFYSRNNGKACSVECKKKLYEQVLLKRKRNLAGLSMKEYYNL